MKRRKLGSMQRAVLESVRDFGDPHVTLPKNRSYEERCRREAVAFDLLRRGWLGLLGYNHPAVVAGSGQWFVTDEGLNVLI